MTMPPYQPDDARLSLEALRALASPEGKALRDAAGETDPHAPAAVAALRRRFSPDAVHAALTLATLQDKARAKFDGLRWVWGVPEALEQATALPVARHKAARLVQAGLPPLRLVLDLCAGIGGDALGLAHVAPTVAVEMSDIRAWCAARNAVETSLPHPLHVVRGDVAQLPVLPAGDVAFHIDPARRAAGRRSHAYADLIPGPAVLSGLIAAFPRGGAIKLSPGVDFADLPEGHLELIAHRGTVVQAVLYTGQVAAAMGGPSTRTASIVDASFSFTAAPGQPAGPVRPLAWIYEASPALHRAELAPAFAATLGLAPLNTDGGYLTSAAFHRHPGLASFAHLQSLAYSEKRLAAALRALPPDPPHGPVEIKTRGNLKIDTDALQRAASRLTPAAVTVLIYRAADGVVASLARRT